MYILCRNIASNNLQRLLRHSSIEQSVDLAYRIDSVSKVEVSQSLQQQLNKKMSGRFRNVALGPNFRRDVIGAGGFNAREMGYNVREPGYAGLREDNPYGPRPSYPVHGYGPPTRPGAPPHYNMTNDVLNLMNAFVSNSMTYNPPRIFQCGELRAFHSGMVVELTGRLIKKRVSRFVELRDRSNGACQLVINEDNHRVANRLQNMIENTMLTVIGTVMLRPKNSCNFSMPTGEIEVNILDIVNTSFPPNMKHAGQKRNFSTMAEQHNCGITSIEYKMSKSDNILKYFACREMTCNDLRREDIGKTVTLVGWIPYMKNSKFMQLKDGYGHTQIVVEDQVLHDTCVSAPEQTVIQVTGLVLGRPKANINMKYETGEIEVLVSAVKILNPDEPYDGPIRNQDTVQKLSIDDIENVEKTPAVAKPAEASFTVVSSDVVNSELPASVSTATSGEAKKSDILKVADSNKFTCRSHNCGELTDRNIGETVALCGWLHTKRMKRFIILRDGYGQTQILITPETEGIAELEKFWPRETILYVAGKVKPRPSAMINKDMKTGFIEVEAEKIEVMNLAKANLPFQVGKCNRAREGLRLAHRYIDLRFADMQQNLRMRSKIIMKMREYLVNYLDFVEVETPTLFRSTPGGAQEFIVPTRKAGHVYSLVQSPQQFKQMLMAGAIDRYFQVARCYRDEATRPDRQPEFTQLDIELSFTTRENVMRLVEEVIRYSWPKDMPKLQTPFRRLTYNEAMDKYGTDKPDTRFSLLLENVSNICGKNEALKAKFEDFAAYAIVIRSQQVLWSKADREQYNNLAREFSGNLLIHKYGILKDMMKSMRHILGDEAVKELAKKFVLEENDLMFLAIGEKRDAQTLMGRIRVDYNNSLIENNKASKNVGFKFVWVVDFPLFINNKELNKLESVHHPFTAPHPEDMEKFNNVNENDIKELESIRSQAYDLVLNGQEIGGGSIRIHDRDTQHYVLEQILKIPQEHLVHLLNALESGCPPHGGIALGLDRFISIIRRTRSIRDVIAFPKSLNGRDPLSNAPFPISEEEKQLYHIELAKDIEPAFDSEDEREPDRDCLSLSVGTLSSEDELDDFDVRARFQNLPPHEAAQNVAPTAESILTASAGVPTPLPVQDSVEDSCATPSVAPTVASVAATTPVNPNKRPITHKEKPHKRSEKEACSKVNNVQDESLEPPKPKKLRPSEKKKEHKKQSKAAAAKAAAAAEAEAAETDTTTTETTETEQSKPSGGKANVKSRSSGRASRRKQ